MLLDINESFPKHFLILKNIFWEKKLKTFEVSCTTVLPVKNDSDVMFVYIVIRDL